MIKRYLHINLTFLLLLTVGFIQQCVALNNGIALKLLNYTVQTSQGTIDLGRTVTINALITNTDTVVFSGPLDFGLRNSLQTLSSNDDIFKKPRYSTNQIVLQPGESVPAIFSVDIEGPYFKPGPDVVVVWPISTSPIIDTILIELSIQGPADLKSGLNESNLAQFGYLVLRDKIQLLNTDGQIDFKQVRIYTILGQQVSNLSGGFITEIPINTLPKGIYLCELVLADNKRRIIRFAH